MLPGYNGVRDRSSESSYSYGARHLAATTFYNRSYAIITYSVNYVSCKNALSICPCSCDSRSRFPNWAKSEVSTANHKIGRTIQTSFILSVEGLLSYQAVIYKSPALVRAACRVGSVLEQLRVRAGSSGYYYCTSCDCVRLGSRRPCAAVHKWWRTITVLHTPLKLSVSRPAPVLTKSAMRRPFWGLYAVFAT